MFRFQILDCVHKKSLLFKLVVAEIVVIFFRFIFLLPFSFRFVCRGNSWKVIHHYLEKVEVELENLQGVAEFIVTVVGLDGPSLNFIKSGRGVN